MTFPRRWRRRQLSPGSWIYLLAHTLVFAVGISLYQVKGAVAFSVATSLMATGIAGWVVFFWVRQNEDTAHTLQSLTSVGLTDAFIYRSVAIRNEYEPRFQASRDQISIMGFGLRALREDFGEQFSSWATSTNVRILLLDPLAPDADYTYANQRDSEENNTSGSIQNDVAALVAHTSAVRRDHPDSFKIRLYRCLPSINVCIVDDEAFWGPYLFGRQSRNTMTLLCRRGGHMYSALMAHFEQIWNSEEMSRPAPDE